MASSDIVQYQTPIRKIGNILIGVFLAIYLVWTLLTFVMMFVSSLKDLLEAFKLPPVGDWAGITMFFDFTPTLRHYENLFLDKNFGTYMMNSIISAGGSAIISVVLGSMCAYALSRTEFRGKKDLLFGLFPPEWHQCCSRNGSTLCDLQELRIGWNFTWANSGLYDLQSTICDLDSKGIL